MAGGAVSLFSWRQIRWPDTWSRYLSFGAVLLLMCAINRVFYVVDYLLVGSRIEEWPFFVAEPQLAVFKGEVLTIVGTLLTVLAWHLAGGWRVLPTVAINRVGNNKWLLLVLYLISIGGMTASLLIPQAAATLGQLIPTMLGFGIISAFLLPLAVWETGFGRLCTTLLLSIPFIIAASGTGMKENMILALLPTAILAWNYFKQPILRVGLLAVGLVALAFITSYVQVFREQVWVGGNDLSRAEFTRNYLDDVRGDELIGIAGKGLTDFRGGLWHGGSRGDGLWNSRGRDV